MQRFSLLLILSTWAIFLQMPTPAALAQIAPVPGIGPRSPYTQAPCNRTLNPGDKIQDAIDAVRNKATPYVLCLNPGYYIGGKNGDTTFAANHDFGDIVVNPNAGGDWWNHTDDGPYYGNIVLKNRRNFTLRGLVKDGQRAVILALPNDEVYPPETASPQDHHPNDKAILIKIVNGSNITLENLTIDGFYYPDFPKMERKVSVLNRLVWLQNSNNSRVRGNLIKNAGAECVRLRSNSYDNEIAYNTIHGCGYYQFKIQPLDRLHKNGESVYIGADPYQITASQTNKSFYWGIPATQGTDGSRNNWVHHNDLFPGAQTDLTPPPVNPLHADLNVSDGYGNECVDVKEDVETIGRLVRLPGVGTQQRINNVISDNLCQGQYDEDSGALDARGSNNLFEHNVVTGTVRGAALRLGGGEPKPMTVDPTPSDPARGCFGRIVETHKWQAYNNRIRNNIFASAFNDFSDFNGRGGYAGSDCDDKLECSNPALPRLIPTNCGEQKTLYVVKTFAVEGHPAENQAPGAGVCGNMADARGRQDWGSRRYKGKVRPIDFSRIPAAAVNLPQCNADANNPADLTAPGVRGCVGHQCVLK